MEIWFQVRVYEFCTISSHVKKRTCLILTATRNVSLASIFSAKLRFKREIDSYFEKFNFEAGGNCRRDDDIVFYVRSR